MRNMSTPAGETSSGALARKNIGAGGNVASM